VRLLGRGGFGEVWKATGPGGFEVALKFIRLGGQAGRVELRSLELMKHVRHAHLLPQFGAWERDDYLIVAMELADRTLFDRLKEAVGEGLPGLPADELIEYLRDAARAIDFLNEPRHPSPAGGLAGIQHKDIKPANLLLVGDTVKVADFGLARVLQNTLATASGGLTPAYAAPELLRGQSTVWSDQYSLAVTYCELRGRRRPFEGDTARIVAGHLFEAPDLSMLPEAERFPVGRALAKEAAQRWPSCRLFVEALDAAVRRGRVPRGGSRLSPSFDRAAQEWAILEIKRHGGTIATEEGDDAGPVVKVDFTHGNIDDAALDHLRALSGLRELNLFGCRNVTDAGLVRLRELPNLEVLTLSNTAVTDAGMIHLTGSTRLRELRLFGCSNVGDAGVTPLRLLPGLQLLELSRTGVTDAGMARLAGLPELRVLELAGTKVTDYGLTRLPAFPRLAELNLHGAWVGDRGLFSLLKQPELRKLNLMATQVSDKAMTLLADLPALETLNLTKTPLTDAGLARLGASASLRTLLLSGTRVGNAGLGGLAGLADLRRLDLAGTEVTDVGLQHLGPLRNLRSLRLAKTQVGDGGLAHLRHMAGLLNLDLSATRVSLDRLEGLGSAVNLRELKLSECRYLVETGLVLLRDLVALEVLHLGSTRVGDEGALHLVPLKDLQVLDLSMTRITDAGLEHLRDLPRLRELSLFCCKGVTDVGVPHLRCVRALRKLVLVDTQVTEEGGEELARALPELTIEWAC
jgi:Leucine-rich repeat (LRR) protein